MRLKQLSYFPKLQTILLNEYREEIIKLLSSMTQISEVTPGINVYSSFIDICIRKPDTQYNAFDIRNSEKKLNTHLSALIGFIYTEIETSFGARYKYSHIFKKVFSKLADRYDMTLHNIKISDVKLSNDSKKCINLYQSMNINTDLIEYYSGWTCGDKTGKPHMLHLATLYDTYGAEFTTQVHVVLSNYARKHKTQTLPTLLSLLVLLLNEFTGHCKTKENLNYALKAQNSTNFMENILNSMLFKSMINNNNPKYFTADWSRTVKHFIYCFIDTGFFEEPLKPFLIPEFREPKTTTHTISIGGDLNDEEKERWLVDIPLEIKDEEALEMIHRRLNLDIEHIRTLSKKMFENLKFRLNRNMKLRESGTIKLLPSMETIYKKVPMGTGYLDNTIATFYHHGFAVSSRTTSFLGFDAQGEILLRELALPTPETLNIFASLLILEHPKITAGWLQEWELFDKNGNQVGLKQAGSQWIIVSLKNRRGATSAQQEVFLTDDSKHIVDVLIEHTRFSREALKKKGGHNWRYMMLITTLQKVIRPRNIGVNLSSQGKYHQSLAVESYDNNQKLILSSPDAKKLAEITTLRSIRKARALQIYLETGSIKAVSEALGHKELRMELMEVYLPKPLMDYFNKRWVRQFQNAIIFEALKDSPYLFDALDFDESALDEFLINHSLGNLPENLERTKSGINIDKGQEHINNRGELVFTLSTPLFQVLFAIRNVIDNASKDDEFKPVINKWYQSSTFILNHFSLTQKGEKYRRPPEETIPLYESAVNNPLDLGRFKENILCR